MSTWRQLHYWPKFVQPTSKMENDWAPKIFFPASFDHGGRVYGHSSPSYNTILNLHIWKGYSVYYVRKYNIILSIMYIWVIVYIMFVNITLYYQLCIFCYAFILTCAHIIILLIRTFQHGTCVVVLPYFYARILNDYAEYFEK